ncbi:hypothetical protein Slala03_62810 [Streptomyces lavendulae subsp. lavendulae]|uniref:hypothetical protein n=1 Tax=Streptomyces lavendulae TaxID=1914 RepID=UPI0024A37C22|nr:hypothetical protein [Streptomyces lavendulae]GLV86592.1 hypothetical protein Slala03_62810 [Streptomyces lavendulae subsp. lavendulae]
MGGWEHTRSGSHGRPVRRAALLLLISFGVAAGVAFLCARPAAAHAPHPGGSGARSAHVAHAACVSPYDLPGCSPLAHVTPAVLPAPPPAVALPQDRVAAAVRPAAAAGPVRPDGTLARAPGRYALQVLRT